MSYYQHPDWYREDMKALFDLLLQRRLTPIIAKRFRLEEAADAHELLSDGSVSGRIMLVTKVDENAVTYFSDVPGQCKQ